jgi:hypothetical protein
MALLDELKGQWDKKIAELDAALAAQREKDLKAMQHDKVRLANERPGTREQSPLERVAPVMANKAAQAEQERKQPIPPPNQQTPEKPTELVYNPEPQTAPNVATVGVTFTNTPTPTGNKVTATVRPSQESQLPPIKVPTKSELKEMGRFEPQPNERLAAKLDRAPASDLEKIAEKRIETVRKLEFYADINRPKHGPKH